MAKKLTLVPAVKYTTGSKFAPGKGTAKRKGLADAMRKLGTVRRKNRVKVAMRQGGFDHIGNKSGF